LPQPDSARVAHRVLSSGGHLAAFWNLGILDERAMDALDEVYAVVAPALAEGTRALEAQIEEQGSHIGAVRDAGFEPIELRTYPWSATYTAQQWVHRIATHSNHALLPTEQREALLSGVAAAIESLGGTVTEETSTALILARRH
jgi:hypothetical protein